MRSTFLLVFTGLEPAANSDIPIFCRWHAGPIGLDVLACASSVVGTDADFF